MEKITKIAENNMGIKDLQAEIGKKFIQREQLLVTLNQLNQEIQALYNKIQEEKG